MFKYRFECLSCEKHIEYKEDVPLLPTCPICQGALEIEAKFSGNEWTPIAHAVLVDFEMDRRMNEFISTVTGVTDEEIRHRLRTVADAAQAYQRVKTFAIDLVTRGIEGEKDMVQRQMEEQRQANMIEEMNRKGVMLDKIDRGMN